MSSKYDRVTYPDDIRFAGHADGDESEDYRSAGNGIYNEYTVTVPGTHTTDSFRVGCFRCEKSRRTFLLLAGLLVVLVIGLIIIIAVSAQRPASASSSTADTNTGDEVVGSRNPTVYGLFAYPTDQSGTLSIRFNPNIYDSYKNYVHNMVHYMSDYHTLAQMDEPQTYIDCDESTTEIPAGQVCSFMPANFGTQCTERNLYGYSQGTPCVLLVLNAPLYVTPKPFNVTGRPEVLELLTGRIDNRFVGISCQYTNFDLSSSNVKIEYSPVNGFPMYYFPKKNNPKYIAPAVMVQFHELPVYNDVKIKCVAWAENFNGGQPQNSPFYSRNIVMKIEKST